MGEGAKVQSAYTARMRNLQIHSDEKRREPREKRGPSTGREGGEWKKRKWDADYHRRTEEI